MHNYNFVRTAQPKGNSEHFADDSKRMSGARRKRSVGYTTKFWENASTITFSFMQDLPDVLKYRIERGIRQWEPFVSLAFELVENTPGAIRIALQGTDSYSFIGTDALREDVDVPTMVLGLAPDALNFDQTVQHEFGHALGFHHAHLHPQANIPWNKEAAYDYLAKHHGWKREDVDSNLFDLELPHAAVFGDYDKDSIMHYPTTDLIYGDQAVGLNLTLSAGDKTFARKTYPALNYGQSPI
ncbi:M12 family metallopeptidase [Pseudomonas sp. NPDC098747]|uniref:M12 family metallopeptidase n=1 Tax=Pseudomonas sp. NPDC098747 TaxID=3364487 RepID=UPI00383B2565